MKIKYKDSKYYLLHCTIVKIGYYSLENILGVTKFTLINKGSSNHNAAVACVSIASLLAPVLLLSVLGYFIQYLVFLC